MSHSAEQISRAVLDLVNSRPRTPSLSELTALIADHMEGLGQPAYAEAPTDFSNSALATEIREAMARSDAATAACGNLLAGPAFDKAAALSEKRCDELRALVARVPSPPRTFGDIALMAEIARHYADRDRNGRMEDLDDYDGFHSSAARLIQAVLQLGHGKAMVIPTAAPALSPEHLAYRQLVAEMERYNDPDCMADDEETDAALSRLQERACELETKIWSKPAKTLADLLLRAEIAFSNENGVMTSLGDTNAYYDDRAQAQLIRAVLDVLGGANV